MRAAMVPHERSGPTARACHSRGRSSMHIPFGMCRSHQDGLAGRVHQVASHLVSLTEVPVDAVQEHVKLPGGQHLALR
jgi:hypothetical protein